MKESIKYDPIGAYGVKWPEMEGRVDIIFIPLRIPVGHYLPRFRGECSVALYDLYTNVTYEGGCGKD